jgi:hypothetical protein
VPTISTTTLLNNMNASSDASRLPEDAGPAELIVCEQTGRWAVALRRELGEAVAVRETRNLSECWDSLSQCPAGFVVVEATAGNLDTLLRRLGRLERDFPLARVAAVAPRNLAEYEWLLREAGAIAFAASPRRLGPLADLIRNHLVKAPRPPQGVVRQIWASLPWQ